ncbi:MAG: hypothetical protein R3F21_09445 [Myxococcota bacterium]
MEIRRQANGWIWIVAILVGGWISDPASAAQIESIEAVALSAQPAPGSAANFNFFNRVRMNDAGEVLLHATLSGGANGLWHWNGSGPPTAVAITGTPAPGLGAAVLQTLTLDPLAMTATGPSFFGWLALGSGVTSLNDDVAWGSSDGGALVVLARQGASAPGSGTQVFGPNLVDLSYSAASDAGRVLANRLSLTPAGGVGERGLWQQEDAALTLVALEGDPAVGVPGGQMIDFRGSVSNDLGELLTNVRVDTVGRALYAFDSNGPQLVALVGDPAPGTSVDFLSLTEYVSELGINDAGEFAFVAGLSDDTVAAFGPDGAGGTRVVLRTGDAAPGTSGAVFAFPDDLALAADGSMVVEGMLQIGPGGTVSSTDRGLWGTAGHGPLQKIARRGDRPAGLPEGARYESFSRWELNGSGTLIFSGTYFPPSSGTAEDAIWHHDLHSGETSLLLRKGDPFEVAPGDTRIVSFAGTGGDASGGQDGKGQGFADDGRFVATVDFTGSTRGVFRLGLPEPTTGASGVALIALAALARRRETSRRKTQVAFGR